MNCDNCGKILLSVHNGEYFRCPVCGECYYPEVVA